MIDRFCLPTIKNQYFLIAKSRIRTGMTSVPDADRVRKLPRLSYTKSCRKQLVIRFGWMTLLVNEQPIEVGSWKFLPACHPCTKRITLVDRLVNRYLEETRPDDLNLSGTALAVHNGESDCDVLDWDEAKRRIPASMIEEISQVLLEECPKLLADVRGALESGSPEKLRLAAHSLKGSATPFAARRVVATATAAKKRTKTHTSMENAMEQALIATQLLFYLLGGLGIFFLGVGSLWFVSVYKAAIDRK